MNLDKKMVLVGGEGQPIEFTWRFHINSVSGSVYLEDSVTAMKSCKSIPDKFDQM